MTTGLRLRGWGLDQLAELASRVQQGRLTPKVGAVRPLAETRDAFQRKQETAGNPR